MRATADPASRDDSEANDNRSDVHNGGSEPRRLLPVLHTEPDADEEESRLRRCRSAVSAREPTIRLSSPHHALRAQDQEVNHKRVARLLRQDNLLGYSQTHTFRDSDGRHDFDVPVDVVRRLTFRRRRTGLSVAERAVRTSGMYDDMFVAVAVDAFSRKIVGLNLRPKLSDEHHAHGI